MFGVRTGSFLGFDSGMYWALSKIVFWIALFQSFFSDHFTQGVALRWLMTPRWGFVPESYIQPIHPLSIHPTYTSFIYVNSTTFHTNRILALPKPQRGTIQQHTGSALCLLTSCNTHHPVPPNPTTHITLYPQNPTTHKHRPVYPPSTTRCLILRFYYPEPSITIEIRNNYLRGHFSYLRSAKNLTFPLKISTPLKATL